MTGWQEYLHAQREHFLEELLDFARIPSISSLPEHAADVQHAAEWVAQRMQAAGIEGVEIMPTGGHPVVYGEWLHAPGKPTVLIYGHFDTQPVDPVELWSNPPFEPLVRDGRIYARGISDDKGNMLIPILAIEALLQSTGVLPLNLKFCFEGQEEIGSPQLSPFLATHHERFACDLVLSADSGQWGEDQPSLMTSARGLAGLQIDVQGASSDLHSGLYGGMVQNPIHALVQILDSMRSPDGRILVEGFYDDVVPLTQEDRAAIAAVPFDAEANLAQLGIDTFVNEPGYTPIESNWARPTLELNGIWGGFQGAGTKTVLPNLAHAKITCRLVPNQEPEKINALIAAHVQRNTPAGVRVTVQSGGGGAKPYMIPINHPANRITATVLERLYGKPPYYPRVGGSVPILEMFQKYLGVYSVGFGFAMNDERFHAPDEFFRIKNFEFGQRAYCELLEELGRHESTALKSEA